MDPWDRPRPRPRRRSTTASPAPRRSRRSPTTRSSRTATPPRWSRRTAPSSGCARRASTRRACSRAILDRGAGGFRLGPTGMGVPAGRRYEPGTNVLETTWQTATGWAVVREALILGHWREREMGSATAHTRPPADHDAYHVLVRTIECFHGSVQVELLCEPMFDYGRTPATLEPGRRATRTRSTPRAPASALRLHSDLRLGIEGGSARARHRLVKGERRFCALSWSRLLDGPRTFEEARREPRGDRRVLAQLARHRPLPRPPLARAAAALGARAEGADLRADRRRRRRPDDVAAGDAGRRAQLGLPLHVDARRDADAVGALLARPQLGGRRLHPVRRRPRAQRRRLAADHVRRRRRARPAPSRTLDHLTGYEGARPVRIGNDACEPAPERRLRRRARLALPAHQAVRPQLAAAVAGDRGAGRARGRGLARARPGDLGGARRAAPLRLLEADVLGRARPRRATRGPPRTRDARRPLARGRQRDPRRHLRARRRRARRVRPALRHRRARRLGAADPARALPARRRPSRARDRAGDRATS